jgi:hypothetical protein
MAFTTIHYEGGNYHDDDGNLVECSIDYKSVEVFYGEEEESKIFNSGNFVKDWFDAMKFKVLELRGKEYGFGCSSSVDHFIMDGAPYDSAYLKDKGNDEWYLDYDNYENGIELFVPEGTKPTWEELKVMCGHIKKEESNQIQ